MHDTMMCGSHIWEIRFVDTMWINPQLLCDVYYTNEAWGSIYAMVQYVKDWISNNRGIAS